MFNPNIIRKDFPILSMHVNGSPWVYLDNAATTQIPESVLETICEQYHHYQSNVHRGIHRMSQLSTKRLEEAREKVRSFINARSVEEVIFTSGTTEAVNMLARGFGEAFLKPGDEVITTSMEHHSNLVPWQEMCRRHEAVLRVLPMEPNGDLSVDRLGSLITPRTRLVAVCAVSNVLGTLNPLEDIVKMAHAFGAAVFVDAAQSVRHGVTNVQELDCDFLAFSGHKLMGPTGTGILYGRKNLLEKLPPVKFGGGMVDTVTEQESTFDPLPFRLEGGTPNIAGCIGLGAAVDYVQSLGSAARDYERSLMRTLELGLKELPEVKVIGKPTFRVGAVSFNVDGLHAFDIAKLLDQLGIAVRSGHHCAQPLLRSFGLESAVRVSPAFYNTEEEIEALLSGLKRIIPLGKGTTP